MRLLAFLTLLGMVGCSTSRDYDARLNGTRRAADSPFPRTITYSNGVSLVSIPDPTNMMRLEIKGGKEPLLLPYGGATNRFRYRIIRQGKDYVDIKYPGHPYRNRFHEDVKDGVTNFVFAAVSSEERIHFAEGGRASWVGEDPDRCEWLYKVRPEPDGAANRSQPIRLETTQPSAAAGSGR
jgi:hypothetical protein